MLLLGINRDFGAYCEKDTYPNIFIYQYGVFFFSYLVFLCLHRNNYFMDWDVKALSPMVSNRAPEELDGIFDQETRNKSRARLIFT